MPSRCCVTNCSSNYTGGPKRSVFKFPENDELRQKWIRAIPRKGFVPTKASRVCEDHFKDTDIRRLSEFYDPATGQKLSAPLLQPRLQPGAVPSIFPNCPKYLSKDVHHRENPDDKRGRLENDQIKVAIAESIRLSEEYNEKFKFASPEGLLMCLKNVTLPEKWTIISRDGKIYFLSFELDPCPFIQVSVEVDKDLAVTIYQNQSRIANNAELGLPSHVYDVHEICTLLSKLNIQSDFSFFDLHINAICSSLMSLLELCKDEDNKKILSFVLEQLRLFKCHKHARNYSSDLLILSCLLHSISPHSYKFLRSTGYIVLPHPYTLRRMCSSFNTNPAIEQFDNNFLMYLKQKVPHLTDDDKNVSLLIDEIHIKPLFNYKAGNLFGPAFNSEEAATSAHVFMIQSAKSVYKDVVHILPVKTLTAPILYSFIRKVVIGLEEIGFNVFCLITDNNSINRKAVMHFHHEEKLSIVYPHPVDPKRPMFYIIDSVHILKCIRNNWLNQKDKRMYFPEFFLGASQSKPFEVASMAVLYKLLEIEENQLVKYAYGLTLKSLNPSNLERQNVKLVLQIFNEFVAEGVRKLGKDYNLQEYDGTANWITIILTWFKIMNVRTPLKGKHKRDKYQEPLTAAADDKCVEFLENVHEWLTRWENMNCNTGRLSRETHLALKHTTHAILEVRRYCTEELNFEYVLTGKFQTDALEERFGRYRQLAGSNYNVSLTEVFEAESKLRIQSLLSLITNDIAVAPYPNTLETSIQDVQLLDKLISISPEDIAKAQPLLPVLAYVAGYCCHSVLKKINNCCFCRALLLTENPLEPNENFLFLKSIDRGGLKYPEDISMTIVLYNYLIAETVTTKEMRHFLKVEKPREVLVQLTTNILTSKEIFIESGCQNSHTGEYLSNLIVWTCSNILLNNFCKNKNNNLFKKKQDTSSAKKKRKLQTLQK